MDLDWRAIQIIILVCLALIGPSSAAFVGVKVSLNGVKKDLSEIKTVVNATRDAFHDLDKRVTLTESGIKHFKEQIH